ncbi:glycosyltransferase [Clostridium perfringens]|uniref:glycosyltransferase n=1 Tax=Clostridium perfringens TaxID=1502 RepID=UPI000F534432|nr:glycosyltransferase [Clostridium perfringens]
MIVAIIVTYNIDRKIIEVFEAIRKQVDKIIIVDNNSNDNTLKLLKKLVEENINVELIENDKNYGIAKALNIGIEVSRKFNPKFLITLDHDSILQHNAIEKMTLLYKKLTNDIDKIGAITPMVYDINKNGYLTKCSEKYEYQYISETIQSGTLINFEVFREINGFNESLKTYYVDTDFFYKLIKARYTIVQCNNAILYHEEVKKSMHKIGTKIFYYPNYSNYALYYRARNYVYMFKNHKQIFSSKDRFLKDTIRIILFDKNKKKSLKYHFKGLKDGIFKFILKSNKIREY